MRVVISGASRGIGKAVAFRFAEAGCSLVLCARDAGKLEQLRSELLGRFPSISIAVIAGDLTLRADADRVAAVCLEQGPPDVLINNAGSYEPGTCIEADDTILNRMMAVNLQTAWNLTKALIPSMRTQQKGHIFNLCSIASLRAYENGGCYSVSKFALYGFTQNLRLELQPHGIKVTAVLPGAVYTDSWGDFDNSTGRIMLPEDIAAMIYAATQLSPQAVVDQLIVRPQLGDL